MTNRVDPVEVLHAALMDSELGIAGAARKVGRSVQVMYNKFSDANPSNEISAREALALASAIKTDRYAQAVAQYFGGVFFKVPDGMAGDDDLFEDYLGIIKEMGELSQAFIKAKEDGEIDRPEFERLTREGYDVVAAIQHFLKDLETCVVDKPDAVPLRQVGAKRA